MSNSLKYHYDVDASDFTKAGSASSDIKSKLKLMGVPAVAVRKVAVAMYEGEINLFVHAGGGGIDVEITEEKICITMEDHGPGIADISLAMTAGYSTASNQVHEMGFGAGMGMPNMKANSDLMEVTSTVGAGTKVYMEIMLNA